MAVAGPSAYLSAPSSPHPFADPGDYYFYTSAPSSPSRIAAIYTDLYTAAEDDADESDFAFSFHGQSDGDPAPHSLAAADDLFEGGMIRPLMPSSTESKEEGIPMKEALGTERRRSISSSLSSSFKGRRAARSLPPMRGSEGNLQKSPSVTSASSVLAKGEGGGSCRKWKLKDLFLFRSASEGRATGTASKDPLRKHTFATPSVEEESANGSRRRGRAAVTEKLSAHEMYYSANRAAAAERKKKTPLPYQGNNLFGYFRFSPVSHGIKKGFGGGFFSS